MSRRGDGSQELQEFRSQESGVRSQESGVRSQESGVRSQESGVRSQESGVRSQELLIMLIGKVQESCAVKIVIS